MTKDLNNEIVELACLYITDLSQLVRTLSQDLDDESSADVVRVLKSAQDFTDKFGN